ncbi:hypothetical protein SS50377_22452 [Spironucleus salmonicida]|uniref:Protein kinase domain-containing protein n=1 Tax=Spironucleus salmonicida TaxID=348837 RepID=V6LC62_9EUKA|nr:hypothetical protein SS50377_22452 [Spironucleus salmonicida]|eukprot:EST42057.1 hypothetical protein SS50377_18364 [Spironucleus salmonicida]
MKSKQNIYYSEHPIIAVKQLPNQQILAVSHRHITIFSVKKTLVSNIQLPPAYRICQATVHSTYISALVSSASHAFPAIFDFAGTVISDAEARSLPVFYAAAEQAVFTAQDNNLYQFGYSSPSTQKIYTCKGKISSVTTGKFLNEDCVFIGENRKITIIQDGHRVAEMTFSGIPLKIVYNQFLQQLFCVGLDNTISFYDLKFASINVKNGPFLKIQQNSCAKLKISCVKSIDNGYLIADDNGRLLKTEIREYQMKDNKRNSQFLKIAEKLPSNIFITGWTQCFSGKVNDMSILGDDICCCSNYVVLETNLTSMINIDDDVCLSFGYSNDSWELYQQVYKTFQLQSADDFFISAEQVDQDAEIKTQLIMLEKAFKNLVIDVYHIFRVFMLANKNIQQPFYIMQNAYSVKQDIDKFTKQFFVKTKSEPLEAINNYQFTPFIMSQYKSLAFLVRSLQKRYRTSLDALKNLHTFLGPRLKDLKEVSQQVREMTLVQFQEWVQSSLNETKQFITDKFDFEKDLVLQYNEDNYSIQQLRYFKNKLQAVTRAAVQVSNNRINDRFSQTISEIFDQFNQKLPLYLIADGYGNVQKLIDIKKLQYDSILGNYDLVQQLSASDLNKPEKFIIVPGSMNRQMYYINQINSIREHNYKVFKSDQKDLTNIHQELKFDKSYLSSLNLVYMQEIYDCFEMHTSQQFLVYRSFQSQASFEQTQNVISSINKEFRGRFQLLEPYEFQQSHTDTNFFQYIFHRPRNTIRLSELIQFFVQKYNVIHLSNVPDKKVYSPKAEQFFKTTIYGEKEIAIILKNLLDFVLFIQKQEKLTIGLDPRKPKVHGKITPHNVFLNLDSLEVHVPYLFENRTFENRNPLYTTLVDDICWEAPECVLAGTHVNTDLWSLGMITIALIYTFMYLPRAAKSSRDNIRPLSLVLSNIGTFYTLTEEIHQQNIQLLSSQKTKTDPFTAQKFVPNQPQLKLLISVLRAQASISTDLRAMPTIEIAQKISTAFINSQEVQFSQFILQQAIFQPVVNENQQAGSLGRIFETNTQTTQILYSIISKELQAILRALLRFSPGARPPAEAIRKDPIFTAIQETQKLKIVKWNNAINMMKAAKMQKEKKVIVNAWENPKSYERGVVQQEVGVKINKKLIQMEDQFEAEIASFQKMHESVLLDLDESQFIMEDYKLKSVKHEEISVKEQSDFEESNDQIEMFMNKDDFQQMYDYELSDDIKFVGSGTVSEDSCDSVVSIKFQKTEEEKQAEYKAYQQQHKAKEHALLQKETDEIKQQMEELDLEKQIPEDDDIEKEAAIYEHEQEEKVENENVYYDDQGNAHYYDQEQQQPEIYEQPKEMHQDPYATNYNQYQQYGQDTQKQEYDPYGEYAYEQQPADQNGHNDSNTFDPFAM